MGRWQVTGTYVDQNAEGGKPADGEEEVHGPVDEAAGKGEEPDEGEENGEARDNLGVDEPGLLPVGGRIRDQVQILAVDRGHDRGEDQLRQPEDHGKEVRQDHLGRLLAWCSVCYGGWLRVLSVATTQKCSSFRVWQWG